MSREEEKEKVIKRMMNSIMAHPDYVFGQEGDEWHDLIESASEAIEKPSESDSLSSFKSSLKEEIQKEIKVLMDRNENNAIFFTPQQRHGFTNQIFAFKKALEIIENFKPKE